MPRLPPETANAGVVRPRRRANPHEDSPMNRGYGEGRPVYTRTRQPAEIDIHLSDSWRR